MWWDGNEREDWSSEENEEGDNELWVDADEVAVQWLWGFF